MRVLLADDQAKVRSALRLLLQQQSDIEVLGEAIDTTGLLDETFGTNGVVITDIDLEMGEALVLRRLFRAWGYASEIFCEARRILPA